MFANAIHYELALLLYFLYVIVLWNIHNVHYSGWMVTNNAHTIKSI